jgi:aspartate ammonia-lyase
MFEELKKFKVFASLNEYELTSLVEISEKKIIEAGEYLFRQNQPRSSFFLVEKGELKILKKDHDELRHIITLKSGDFAAENALLEDRPHGASGLAKTKLEVLEFEKKKIDHLLDGNHLLAGKIYSVLAKMISKRMGQLRTRTAELQTKAATGIYRKEHDLLGDMNIPDNVYYGVQTHRANENFDISNISLSNFPVFIQAFAMVKKSCAYANFKLGSLDGERHRAIEMACDELIDGEFLTEFNVDMFQGGAGTSTNMNINEVIANRASEILGHKRGSYFVHPNNHVNLSQSTNDAYPTSIRLAILLRIPDLISSIKKLKNALFEKSVEFSNVIKMGRTQLQDAVPMTLGQEFSAFADTINEEISRYHDIAKLFTEINLGGTAIGTGINAEPDFGQVATNALSHETEIDFRLASNLIEATHDTGAFVSMSSTLKRTATKLSKISNDLRLLSSGPRAGLNEINLPAVQPGSSIMPGKVNPVIPEVVNQISFQVIGNDLTITMASEAGQLQLNVMEPVIVFNLFQSIKMLINGMNTLTDKCVKGITANKEHCEYLVKNSIGLVTALNPYIGYENSTSLAKDALEQNCSVTELAIKRKLLTEDEIKTILEPEQMTKPRKINRN